MNWWEWVIVAALAVPGWLAALLILMVNITLGKADP